MKLYTKSGDDGTTGLYGGDRVSKTAPRIQAIGEIDELNSMIGLTRLYAANNPLDPMLARVQNLLFDLGAELASPPGGKFNFQGIFSGHVDLIEQSIDELDSVLPPLKVFILPGGSPLATHLHLARSVCRRAERAVLALNSFEEVQPWSKLFLNRLSDWLFVAARTANQFHHVNDIEWRQSKEL